MIMDKDKTFTFPKDSQIKIPEKYNEEWLKTASMEDKVKFLDEFLNGFNGAYEHPNLYVKDSNDEKKEDKIKVQCFLDEPIGYEDEFSILEPIFEQKEFENANQVVDYIVKTSTDYLDRYKSDMTIDFKSMKCEEHDGDIYVMAMINNKLKIEIAKLNKMIEI